MIKSRLLNRRDIAAILGTSPDVAASILIKNGCHPIDFGRGRGKGLRWLESAVYEALERMHLNAQMPLQKGRAEPAPRSKKTDKQQLNLANANLNELHAILTGCAITQ